VIFLEDLQWSDEGSCELLERLAVKLDGRSLTLIVSYRDTEVDSSHPVSRLKEVLKSGEIGFDDIQVKAFELEQTKEIVSRVLLEPPERVERLADYLRGRTHGNPFFILELLRTMVEEGVVRYENGRCHFDAAELERVNLPDNIVEAVLRRMRDLPEADLQVLSFAAVIGKQVELGLLSALTNRQTEDLLGSIDRAIEHQVLARDIAEEDSVSFVHDRVREAFYSRVNDVGVLHRQIAEALEVQNPKASGSVVYDLAYHFSQGNVSQKALDYSLQAAEMAAQSTAHDLAIDLFEKARLIFESERMTRDERYMGLLEQLGESYRISGHYDDAIRTLQRCEHLVRRHHAAHSSPEGASPKGSPQRGSSDIARVLAKMSDAYFEKGEATKAATLIERALKGLGLEIPQNRVVIMVGAAWQLFKHLAHMLRPRRWSRRFAHLTEREATIARMMARLTYIYYFNDMEKTFYCAMLNTNFLENHYPSRQLASQYGLGGPLWISMPWFWKAKWDLDRCMELAREFQDTHAEARCYSYLSFRARTMNRPREGLEYCAKGIRMLRKIGEFYDLGVGYVFREHCNSLMTPSSQAIDENKEFVQMSRDGHLDQVLSWALMFSGYYVTLRGEISEAVLEDVRESAEMGLRLNDRPSALLGLAILARGYLRRKDYTNALATVRRIEG
ncbi:MAG: hypothetical protein JO317_02445, partial [Verrucomicrobiae bacterium]|nr:hypothetical protein [Verrucomicrobiae bacterium]